MIKQFITPVLLLISGFCFAQGDVLKSNRTTPAAIKVDGDASEWQLPLRYYDNTTKLFFDFSNDDNNLYLCFQSQDDVEQMKIMRAGMTVTLKIKGGGKASIKFPLEKTPTEKMMEVKGFKTKDGIIPSNDNSGINVAMNRDNNRKLTYEVSIPLKELSGDNYEKDFSKDLDLAVEIHALKEGSGSGKSGSGYSGKGSGGGGMGGGGGRHGGGGGGRSGNTQRNEQNESDPQLSLGRSSMYESTEFKQKFTLAVK